MAGEGQARRVIEAEPAALTELLRRVMLKGAGLGSPWDVEVGGQPDGVRYALEATALLGRCSPPWHPGLHHAAITGVDAEHAADLHDAWTPSLVLRLSTAVEGGRLLIVREAAARAVVEAEGGLPPAVARLLPVATGAPAAPVADARARRSPALDAAAAGSRWALRAVARHRPGRAAIGGSAAAVVGLTLLALFLWGPLRHRTPLQTLGSNAPEGVPLASGSALAADVRNGGLVMAACCEQGQRTAVWTWTSGHWTHRRVGGPAPRFQRGAAFTWDAATGEMLLQGGADTAETWTWNGARWLQRHPAHSPPAGSGVATYDPSVNGVVLVMQGAAAIGGGQQGGTWLWDGNDWNARQARTPVLNGAVALAFDLARRNVVLLDPSAGTPVVAANTWTFDGSAWTPHDVAGPPADPSAQLAWDPQSQRVVAAELGTTANPANGIVVPLDSWTWDGASWTHAASGASPQTRGKLITWLGSAVFVADPDVPGAAPDFWSWQGSAWSPQSGGPSAPGGPASS